MTEKSSIWVY